MKIKNDLIVCPVCGGDLEFWKEYIVTKTQAISKNGIVRHTVKTSKPVEFNCDDMSGFKCTKCLWVLNIPNYRGDKEEYNYLEKWLDLHGDELKV